MPANTNTTKLLNKQAERKIVSKVARGNMGLQQGFYQTSEDITKKVQKLSSYKFSK